MKRISLLMILIASLVGLWSCSRSVEKEAIGAEGKTKKLSMQVKVSKVIRTNVSYYLSNTGIADPVRKAGLIPNLPGRIAKIYVKEGQSVKSGDLLMRLDDTDAKLRLRQAEAGLAVAEANMKNAKVEFERMKKLRESNSISQQAFDKVKLGYEAAKSNLEQAQSGYALAKYMISQTALRAPFDGIITHINLKEGEYSNPAMAASGNPLMVLMDASTIEVNIDVSDRDVVKIKEGMEAEVKLDALPDTTFSGTVYSVGKASKIALPQGLLTGLFKVCIRIDNKDGKILPGMLARINIAVETHRDVLAVPNSAIILRSGKPYVFSVENGRAKKIPVELGLKGSDLTEVTNGVTEGMAVVVEGNSLLKDGSPVTVIE